MKKLRHVAVRIRNFAGDLMLKIDPRFHYKPRISWWHDRTWMAHYQKYLEVDGRKGTRILDRRFTLLQIAKAVKHLHGSTAECGVARGVGSALICKELEGTYETNELHFAFDSFEGVSDPVEEDRMANGRHHWYKGKLRAEADVTSNFLKEFSVCKVVKGWIPHSLKSAEEHCFRLLHIDVDLYEPTRDSLQFFYPKLCSGGIILFDDHGFIDCPGARIAANEFFADKPEAIIALSTGQALVTKI